MEQFLPFGSQYYRAPTPLEQDWETDLKNFAGHGFNFIKLWAQWRWNNPAQDEYYFDDLDRLMDICHENNLKVCINIIYDVAPAWLYTKYPDSVMINSQGVRIEPTTSACRQIGGLPGPCFHHDIANEEKLKFTRAVVERYKDHPAMYLWDLWNEPELCYNARKPDVNNLVCYCGNTREKFIEWLEKKYGSLQAVNKAWARNYRTWEEFELPRDPRTFKDMIDWRLFFVETLSGDLRKRMELTKQLDPRHAAMAHTVAGFNKVNGCDDYEIASMCDWFGGSTNNEPYACRTYASNGKGKRVIASEIHANGGYTLDRGKIRSLNEYKEFILLPVSMGYTGFMYWQYRPELIGKEAPMWGMTYRDGAESEWLKYSKTINQVLQDNKDILLEGSLAKPQVGVIYSLKNQIFNWCANFEINTHDHSVTGAHNLFYNLNVNADVVDVKRVQEGELSQYKLLYYPFPYYMEAATANALKKWVAEGGVLISEAFFGSYDDDTGLHSIHVPGFGMDEVFGVREDRATCTSHFIHSYDDFDGIQRKNQNDVLIKQERGGGTIAGYYFIEELKAKRAQVLGRFAESALAGSPAITAAEFGKGRAVMIGTLLAKRYQEAPSAGVEAFMREQLKICGIDAETEVLSQGKVKLDLIRKGSEAVAVIRNLETTPQVLTFRIKDGKYKSMADPFNGSTYGISAEGCFTLQLEAGEINLYRLSSE